MSRFTYGGQALIEGVLMRGRDAIAVALRHPDGRIVWASEPLGARFHGTRQAKLPFVRGLVVLYETLVVGTRWLVRSANVSAEEDGVELGRGSIAAMLGVTFVAAIGIFFLLPLAGASVMSGMLSGIVDDELVQHLLEGLIRVVIFIGYLAVISTFPDIRRVFQYHGAEHMTIHALEAGDPLEPEAIRKYPTAHPRCGTEFLVVVIALSIVAFALVGRQDPVVMVGSRILLIPIIAAVGYEILRFGARHRSNPIVKAVMYPGILVQKITTRQPSDDMIEVAIVSMEQALQADGEPLPKGAGKLERHPLPSPAEVRARRAGAAEARESGAANASGVAAANASEAAAARGRAPEPARSGGTGPAGTPTPGTEAAGPISIDPPVTGA